MQRYDEDKIVVVKYGGHATAKRTSRGASHATSC